MGAPRNVSAWGGVERAKSAKDCSTRETYLPASRTMRLTCCSLCPLATGGMLITAATLILVSTLLAELPSPCSLLLTRLVSTSNPSLSASSGAASEDDRICSSLE